MRPMRPGLGSKMDGRCLGVLLLSFFCFIFDGQIETLTGKLQSVGSGTSKTWGLFGDRSILTKLQRADFPKVQISEIWSG